MSRYNYSATSAYLAALFGWRNAELGIFETVMPLVYGLSVVLNGPLADRIGGKRAFLIGAAGALVMNLLFGATAFFVISPATWEGIGAARHVITPVQLASGLEPRTLLLVMAGLSARD